MELLKIAPKDVFYRIVEANIRNHLPAEYENAVVVVDDIPKATETYKGLLVKLPSRPIMPTINLDLAYEWYIESEDMSATLDKIAEIVTMEIPEEFRNMPDMTDYEQIKDKIAFRLTSAEGKDELMDNVPHRFLCDMLITFYIEFGQGIVTISNEMLESYGISETELFSAAKENAQKMLPVAINSISSILGTGDDDSVMLITNQKSLFGAAAILYDGVLDKVTEGETAYLLPSSVHEFLVYKGEQNPEELKKIVISANTYVVEPEDKLSDNVYIYENGTIDIAA